MKKHQTIAIVAVIILAIAVGVVIALSKKSAEKQPLAQTPPSLAEPRDTSSYKEEDPAPVTTVKTFTLAEVAPHNSRSSCYAVVSGSVYDLTPWIAQHPGGQFPILGMCGKDGTASFNGQHGGQAQPETELASFKIGTLVQ